MEIDDVQKVVYNGNGMTNKQSSKKVDVVKMIRYAFERKRMEQNKTYFEAQMIIVNKL